MPALTPEQAAEFMAALQIAMDMGTYAGIAIGVCIGVHIPGLALWIEGHVRAYRRRLRRGF